MAGRAPYCPVWLVRVFPFLTWFGTVRPETLRADLMAGLSGAVIVLPQGVAFALIAGLPPEYGLYTAIVTSAVAALFGSSRHMVSGPTTAISIVVFATVSRHAEPGTPQYLQLVLTLTFLAGAYQLGLGLARLGALVNFISQTVVVAFTAGAAILIATSQLHHVTGIVVPRGESFVDTWIDLYQQLDRIDPAVLAVAFATFFVAALLHYLWPRLPNLLLAMVTGSLVALALVRFGHDVPMVGEIPARLPPFSSPDFSLEAVRRLASGAFAVALIGLMSAVSISRAVAVQSGQRIDSNQEFIGQGLSNIAGSFFSCYAGSGSFTRSGINYQSGARTPLSAVFAATILALILLTVAPLTAYLPQAAMGGIILLVAYNLIDRTEIALILRSGAEEVAIFAVTCLSALFLELEFAIYAGVFMSLFFYLRRTTRPKMLPLAPDPRSRKRRFETLRRRRLPECPQLKILRIDGALYFGAVNHVADEFFHLRETAPGMHSLLLVADGVGFLDLAGAELLAQEARKRRMQGGRLYVCGLKRKAKKTLVRSGLLRDIGVSALFPHKPDAIREIVPRLDPEICATCTRRIFHECAQQPGPPEEAGEAADEQTSAAASA